MVGNGYHIALSRENAKRVFSAQGDDALLKLVEEFKASKAMKADGQLLDLKKAWDPIHRCLTDGDLDPAGGEFPLNHVILGGKQLHKGDAQVVVLVRPDMVGFITEALRDLKEPDFRKRFFELVPAKFDQPITEKEYTHIWAIFREVLAFYEYCDEERMAVLFVGQMNG